jgi:hypothetical protein
MINLTKKEYEILIKSLEKLYTFTLDWYKIPKFTSKISSVETLRNKLIGECSKGEISYINMLSKIINEFNLSFECYFIRQFPFILEDKELWKTCCNENGIEEVDRSVIFTDIYFPRLNKVIEIDYNYTHQNPNYDKSRDSYLYQKYGILTCRIQNYSKSKNFELIARKNTYDLLVSAISQFNAVPIDIDFQQALFDLFCYKFGKYFDIFNSIRINYKTINRIPKYDPIHKNKTALDNIRFIYELIGY